MQKSIQQNIVSYTNPLTVEISSLEHLSFSDFKRVLLLGNMLKTEFNIICNVVAPHDLNTLSQVLDVNKDDCQRMLKRLIEYQIIAHVIIPEYGYKNKLYVLNPFMIQKQSTLSPHCVNLFLQPD